MADKDRDTARMAAQMGVSQEAFLKSQEANRARVQEQIKEATAIESRVAKIGEPSPMDRLKGMIKDAFGEATQVFEATVKVAMKMEGSSVVDKTLDAVARGGSGESETNRRVDSALKGLER